MLAEDGKGHDCLHSALLSPLKKNPPPIKKQLRRDDDSELEEKKSNVCDWWARPIYEIIYMRG